MDKMKPVSSFSRQKKQIVGLLFLKSFFFSNLLFCTDVEKNLAQYLVVIPNSTPDKLAILQEEKMAAATWIARTARATVRCSSGKLSQLRTIPTAFKAIRVS